jgi:hypothetical protein
MKAMQRIVGVLFLMLVFLVDISTAAAQSRGKTYKWVDDKGVVHYSDKAPPEAADREKMVLDQQARQLRRIEAPPSPEAQQKLKAEDFEKHRLEQAQKETAARRDRALLSSYLTEADFDIARDHALGALDAQIKSAQTMLAQHQARQKMLLKQQETGTILAVGELEKLEEDIASRNASIERGLREKEGIRARYERDKQRWLELKNADQQTN